MKPRIKLAIGLATVLGVVVAVLFATGFAYRYLPNGHDYAAWPGRPQLELMPPDSLEYSEKHVLGPDGKEVHTDVVYRNHDTGDRTWAPATHKLIQERVFYPEGTPRSNALFGKDGQQIVSGEARRDDHSLLWTAKQDADGTVITTMYWYDGSLFGIQKRKPDDFHFEATYYRRNGNVWAHQIGIVNALGSLTLDELYDKDGHRVYVHTASGNNGSDTFYRPDGTISYVQNYSVYTYTYSGPGDYGGGSYKSLKTVDEFAADGTTLQRHIDMMGGGSYPDTITVIANSGAKTVYKVTYDGTVTHVEAFDKKGNRVRNEDVKSGKVKITLPKELTANEPTGIDAVKIWQEREKNPASRQVVAP